MKILLSKKLYACIIITTGIIITSNAQILNPLKRIFHLKEHTKKTIPSFETLADKLEDSLIQKAIAEETFAYIFKLRKRFGFDENQLLEIPNSFQPFIFTGHAAVSPH